MNKAFTVRKFWLYAFIFIISIAGYFISKSILGNKIVEKEITYTSNTASEVYMVWGLIGKFPAQNLWPTGSYAEDELIYKELLNVNGKFITSLKLPVGSDLYRTPPSKYINAVLK